MDITKLISKYKIILSSEDLNGEFKYPHLLSGEQTILIEDLSQQAVIYKNGFLSKKLKTLFLKKIKEDTTGKTVEELIDILIAFNSYRG